MKKISARASTFILLLLTIIFISAITLVIGVPSIKIIMDLREEVASARAAVDQEHQNIRVARRSRQNLGDVEDKVNSLKGFALNKNDDLYLIESLEALAKGDKSKTFENINFTDGGKNKSYYTVNFSARDKYQNLLSYLKEIERLPYYVIISDISFERANSDNDPEILMRFGGKIYAN